MSTGEGGSPVKPLSAMPSFFARMPFGPAAMVFGSDSVPNAQSPSNNIEEFNDGGNDGCKSTDTISRRHSSIFGVPEWPEVTTEFSIDDYFANGSMKKYCFIIISGINYLGMQMCPLYPHLVILEDIL